MKKMIHIFTAMIVCAFGSGCSQDTFDMPIPGEGPAQTQQDWSQTGNNTDNDDGVEADPDGAASDYNGTATAKASDLSFTVAFDRTALSESVSVDKDDDDFVENTTFDRTIRITFSTSGNASVSGDTDGTVTVKGNDVTASNTTDDVILYVLTGKTTDGFFKLYSDRKSGIRLEGVSIKNPDGAAINNQSQKRTFVILADGTENSLADGTSYADATDEEDMKATFFSEGQLIFSGKGSLDVDANAKAGIRSDDYVRMMPGVDILVEASSGNALRGNDAVIVTGGVLNLKATGDGDKGISSDGLVQFDGGRTTILTSGGSVWDDDDSDYSAAAGIKADSLVRFNGGTVNIASSGAGAKGVSCDGKIFINAGTLRAAATGSNFSKGSYSKSAKGVKADGNIVVAGGTTLVRSAKHEGVESKGAITISGGTLCVSSSDDAVNSRGNLVISDGYVYARATGNDGLDANKDVTISGGTVVAIGCGAPENGIDAAEGYSVYIDGGTVIALGGSVSQTASSSKQASVATQASKGTKVGLFDGSDGLLAFQVPSDASGTGLMISSPDLKSGSKYTLKTGVTGSGTDFFGLWTDGASGGSGSTSLTASTQVGTGMGGGMGGFPGSGGFGW